jgi:hypothetical protein
MDTHIEQTKRLNQSSGNLPAVPSPTELFPLHVGASDPRVERTQRLFWEICQQREFSGGCRMVTRKLNEMAHLHEARGRELLSQGEPDGWIDWYAAITAWAEAGGFKKAELLIQDGRHLAASFADGQENILQQLNELESWMNSLHTKTIPALMDFARQLPTYPVEAA